MSTSIILLLTYLGLLVLLMMTTFVTATIWLFAKSNEKTTCGNILLITATLCAVCGLLSTPVMKYIKSRHEISSLEAINTGISAENKADNWAKILERAQASDSIKTTMPRLAWLPKFLDMKDADTVRTEMAKYFSTSSAEDNQNAQFTIRRAIFAYDNAQPFVDNKDDLEVKSPVLTLFRNIDKPTDQSQLQQNVELLESKLPENWYRFAALKALYTTAGRSDGIVREQAIAKLKALEEQQRLHLNQRLGHLLAATLLTLTSIVGGIVALGLFAGLCFRDKEENKHSAETAQENEARLDADDPINRCTFKRLYCLALIIFYAQFLLALPIGFAFGLQPEGLKLFKTMGAYFTLVTQFASILMLLLTTKLLISKPLGVSLLKTLIRPAKTGILSQISWGIGTFFALRCLHWIYIIAVVLFFKNFPTSDSAIQQQITNAATNQNILETVVLWFSISILAPLTEEIGFRRLLYGCLKSRVGVFWSTIFSAALFAIFHMEINVLVSHFVIGVALAIIYERNRSLIPCIITHSLWNTSVLVYAWLNV